MVSPVWYTIRRVGEAMYDLRGEHDVDASWMEEVRGEDSRGDKIGRIMPRFSVEGWDQAAYQELASNLEAVEELIHLIIDQVKYRPNPFARLMRGGNMGLMGLLWNLLFRNSLRFSFPGCRIHCIFSREKNESSSSFLHM
jgi:hypothetical protein